MPTKELIANKLRYVSLNELTTPKENHLTRCDRYVICRNNGGNLEAVYYTHGRDKSLQCNPNKEIAEDINGKLYGDMGFLVVFVPVIYERFRVSDWVD